jgi:Zn-dependent peptidase ImmA (M78 family)
MKAQAVSTVSNRRALADKAMRAAIAARLKAGKDLISPVCIYAVAEAHGVEVRFTEINMEGMYQRGAPSRIHLSSKRPLPRRTYSCAHELGHHVLGHGSSIDELRENQDERPWDIPDEYSADTFASYMLMPTLALRNAFVVRGLKPDTATPQDLFRIACQFGVGYRSLITHLLWGEHMVGRGRAEELRRHSPKSLRAQILGKLTPQPLVVADTSFAAPCVDLEVGHLLLAPAGAVSEGQAIAPVGSIDSGVLFEAIRPGLARLAVPGSGWATFGRVARKEYVGRAVFRHLEEEGDD